MLVGILLTRKRRTALRMICLIGLQNRLPRNQAEAERINASLSALIDTFGEKPLPAIAAQYKRGRVERSSAIESEVAELRQQHIHPVSHKAEIPRLLLSERDKAFCTSCQR